MDTLLLIAIIVALIVTVIWALARRGSAGTGDGVDGSASPLNFTHHSDSHGYRASDSDSASDAGSAGDSGGGDSGGGGGDGGGGGGGD